MRDVTDVFSLSPCGHDDGSGRFYRLFIVVVSRRVLVFVFDFVPRQSEAHFSGATNAFDYRD